MASLRLSIIVPVFNVEGYLHRCLETCSQQDISLDEYEIIIVNDGSTDQSLSIAEEFAASNSNVKVYSQENGGLSRARNAGLEKAQGEYIWFVDSDDAIAPNCLAGILAQCRDMHLDILAIGRERIGEGKGSVLSYTKEQSHTVITGKEAMKKRWMRNVCAPFYLFRRSFLLDNSLSFLLGYLHEDEAFTPVAFYLAERVSFSTEVCYLATTREGSIMSTPNPKRAFDLISISEIMDVYSANLPKEDRALFSQRIAELLNQAMKLSRNMPEQKRVQLQELLWERRALLKHMLRSSKPSFILAGFILRLSPRHSLALYSSLLHIASRVGLAKT